MKPIIKTIDLVVKKPYRVIALKELNTQYGVKLALELEEFMYILPESYAKRMRAILLTTRDVNTDYVYVTLMEPKESLCYTPNLVFSCIE